MTTAIYVLAGAAGAGLGYYVRQRFDRWRRRRRGPDHCRTCDRQLKAGQVYEVRTGHDDAEDGWGGTYLSITYCRRHAPKDAVRP